MTDLNGDVSIASALGQSEWRRANAENLSFEIACGCFYWLGSCFN